MYLGQNVNKIDGGIKMSNFTIFNRHLTTAIEFAEMEPTPSRKTADAIKKTLKSGLTVGQARLVIQVYNSVRKTINYNMKKNATHK